MEGNLLSVTLAAAVPLWIVHYREVGEAARQEELKRLNESDFCFRMEYVLHRGPKVGDSAKALNDLAKAIALLSFCPGGVKCFGQHFEAAKMPGGEVTNG